MKSHFRFAFSLVELLVALSVIVILLGILIPVVFSIRNKVEVTQCVSNLRTIFVAMKNYSQDNQGYLPAVSPSNNGHGDWIPELVPYYSSYPAEWRYLSNAGNIMVCPTQQANIEKTHGYISSHTYGMNFTLGLNSSPAITLKRTWDSIPKPATTILVTEAGYNRATSVDSLQPYYLYISGTVEGEYVGGVHDGANNVLWCDGHVDSFQDVRTLNPSGTSSGYGVGGPNDKYWSPGFDYRAAQSGN